MNVHKIEIQDHLANIYYPHTDASVVGMQSYKKITEGPKRISTADTIESAIGKLEGEIEQHKHRYAESYTYGGAAIMALECNGNSETATRLKTPVNINGVKFDGTKNIEITTVPSTDNLYGVSLNDVTTPGFYYGSYANECTDKPYGVEDFGMHVIRTSDDCIYQELTSSAGLVSTTYYRNYVSEQWSEWKKVYTESNPQTSITGNAASASKLKTPRTIAITGGATGTATAFDGSTNINIPITSMDPSKLSSAVSIEKGGTGATTSTGALLNLGLTASAAELNYTKGVKSSIQTQIDALNNHGLQTNNPHVVTKQQIGLGNVDNTADSTKIVAKANQLTNSRKIALTGAITGSGTFNGSGDLTINTALSTQIDNALTGVTVIEFNTGNIDTASISTVTETEATYLDFNLSKNLKEDKWRWRFTPEGEAVYDAMILTPTAYGKADLYVGGNKVSIDGHTHNYASSSTAGGAALSAITCTGNSETATKLKTARNITLTGDVSGKGTFDGSGDLVINTTSNDFTSTIELTKTLTITKEWKDTGISGNDLTTGSYVMQAGGMSSDATSTHQEIWTGFMSWFADATSSTDADEILLHKAGKASNENTIFMRTVRSLDGKLKLQIASNNDFTSSNITFKFRRLL